MNFVNGALSLILLVSAMPGLAQAGRPVLTPQQPPAPSGPPAANTPAATPSPAGTAPAAGMPAEPATPTVGTAATKGSAATPHATPQLVGPDYRIGPDDSLQVTVDEDPHMSGAVLVRPDGKISLPTLGDITAAGLTPVQLGANIAELAKKYIKDPTVTVAVLAINSKQVILIGEVMHVGPVPIRPDMTVLQAIVTAGGLTPYANKKKIYVLRGEPGKQQRLSFNYKKALLNDDMLVQPGDRIVVPD
ncbi:MAG TPA: polysaccharide biosynthesis/export family protein [Acidobacteriaceae bacterium]|nr:polysaccharide biosynthesis/export family protein [Acidobacteriaceae bacterium]